MGQKELEIETLHLFFGAFAVITGALANASIALAEHADVWDRARSEVRTVTPSGPFDLQRFETPSRFSPGIGRTVQGGRLWAWVLVRRWSVRDRSRVVPM